MEVSNTPEVLSKEADADEKAKKKEKKSIQFERTRIAFERSQLAWIRTTLTLLTIGVGAYEVFYNRHEMGKAPLLKYVSGRELGFFLIATSFVMLLGATVQHRHNVKLLKQQHPECRRSMSLILSYLLLALCLFLSVMVSFTL